MDPRKKTTHWETFTAKVMQTKLYGILLLYIWNRVNYLSINSVSLPLLNSINRTAYRYA